MSNSTGISINLAIPAMPETQNPEIYAAVAPMHNAIRQVAYALDAYTGRAEYAKSEYQEVSKQSSASVGKSAVVYVEYLEDCAAGYMVALVNSGGKLKARKALQGSYKCRGFCAEKTLAGTFGPVQLWGINPFISGLTPGQEYYLSSVTAGNISTGGTQNIGIALSTTELWMTPT